MQECPGTADPIGRRAQRPVAVHRQHPRRREEEREKPNTGSKVGKGRLDPPVDRRRHPERKPEQGRLHQERLDEQRGSVDRDEGRAQPVDRVFEVVAL
ncbi:MAG: hypothetical protein RLZZ383_1351 [Pseudomonadota bacterium]